MNLINTRGIAEKFAESQQRDLLVERQRGYNVRNERLYFWCKKKNEINAIKKSLSSEYIHESQAPEKSNLSEHKVVNLYCHDHENFSKVCLDNLDFILDDHSYACKPRTDTDGRGNKLTELNKKNNACILNDGHFCNLSSKSSTYDSEEKEKQWAKIHLEHLYTKQSQNNRGRNDKMGNVRKKSSVANNSCYKRHERSRNKIVGGVCYVENSRNSNKIVNSEFPENGDKKGYDLELSNRFTLLENRVKINTSSCKLCKNGSGYNLIDCDNLFTAVEQPPLETDQTKILNSRVVVISNDKNVLVDDANVKENRENSLSIQILTDNRVSSPLRKKETPLNFMHLKTDLENDTDLIKCKRSNLASVLMDHSYTQFPTDPEDSTNCSFNCNSSNNNNNNSNNYFKSVNLSSKCVCTNCKNNGTKRSVSKLSLESVKRLKRQQVKKKIKRNFHKKNTFSCQQATSVVRKIKDNDNVKNHIAVKNVKINEKKKTNINKTYICNYKKNLKDIKMKAVLSKPVDNRVYETAGDKIVVGCKSKQRMPNIIFANEKEMNTKKLSIDNLNNSANSESNGLILDKSSASESNGFIIYNYTDAGINKSKELVNTDFGYSLKAESDFKNYNENYKKQDEVSKDTRSSIDKSDKNNTETSLRLMADNQITNKILRHSDRIKCKKNYNEDYLWNKKIIDLTTERGIKALESPSISHIDWNKKRTYFGVMKPSNGNDKLNSLLPILFPVVKKRKHVHFEKNLILNPLKIACVNLPRTLMNPFVKKFEPHKRDDLNFKNITLDYDTTNTSSSVNAFHSERKHESNSVRPTTCNETRDSKITSLAHKIMSNDNEQSRGVNCEKQSLTKSNNGASLNPYILISNSKKQIHDVKSSDDGIQKALLKENVKCLKRKLYLNSEKPVESAVVGLDRKVEANSQKCDGNGKGTSNGMQMSVLDCDKSNISSVNMNKGKILKQTDDKCMGLESTRFVKNCIRHSKRIKNEINYNDNYSWSKTLMDYTTERGIKALESICNNDFNKRKNYITITKPAYKNENSVSVSLSPVKKKKLVTCKTKCDSKLKKVTGLKTLIGPYIKKLDCHKQRDNFKLRKLPVVNSNNINEKNEFNCANDKDSVNKEPFLDNLSLNLRMKSEKLCPLDCFVRLFRIDDRKIKNNFSLGGNWIDCSLYGKHIELDGLRFVNKNKIIASDSVSHNEIIKPVQSLPTVSHDPGCSKDLKLFNSCSLSDTSSSINELVNSPLKFYTKYLSSSNDSQILKKADHSPEKLNESAKQKIPVIIVPDINKQIEFLSYLNLQPSWVVNIIKKKIKNRSCTLNKIYNEKSLKKFLHNNS